MNDAERKIVDDLAAIRPDLEAWGAHVDKVLVEELLPGLPEGVVKIGPRFRLKEHKSYLFKVLYRDREYQEPLVEVIDKVATRVVLLKSNQIGSVAALIKGYPHWNYKVTKRMEEGIEDQPKVFDYQSLHIVVWPKDDYKPAAASVHMLTCEIQIRTLLQHAFAEVSHDSTYKGTYRNDTEILRHLAKSMALMESTDDYFCKVFELMADEKREFSLFLKELITSYKQYFPEFDKGSMNYDLNYRLFELKLKKDVSIHDIEAFVKKHHDDLRRGLRLKNGLLFAEPVIILIAYYLIKDRYWLKEEWPLSQESLQAVFRAFNFAFDDYR